MTAPVGRPVRGRRLPSWPQWGGTLVAVAASLAALSLPGGTARAATTTTPSYDQITGVGPTASAITVPWTQGLLDNTNTPIASANTDRTNKSSALWFMYQGFQTLSVTVSQTQDIGHQGITVEWTWDGVQTIGAGSNIAGNYLQMMECYGDASTGPTPEQCEYGTPGLLPSGAPPGIASRTGNLCTSSTPSAPGGVPSLDGEGPAAGCDPAEPSDATHLAPCPGDLCDPDSFDIPFDPVTDTNQSQLDYEPGDTTYYSEANTDEVQAAVTSASGGQLQFETLTGVQAPGLGCGEAEADNSPRGCWLVIVPRGEYEPNGYEKINTTTGVSGRLESSPLSATNWAQRIQIHLDFAPVGSFCPPGTAEIQTFGTQVVTRAMQSWQLALNQAGNCSTVYAYSAVTEQQNTLNLTAGGDVGLAFTTIPIGSEATRDGGSAPSNLPTILYAPVAVAALDFGFNINIGNSGSVTTPVNLTPLLVAKAVTQSYAQDLPDFDVALGTGPSWAQGIPLNISEDPEFAALNPDVPSTSSGPLAPLLTEDHSALNQQIWQWIQSSSAATAWLGGTPDKNADNMALDPDYQSLNLATPPAIDSFPRAYTSFLSICEPSNTLPASSSPQCPAGSQIETKHDLDLLPYTNNYDSAAAAVLSADNTDESGGWDTSAIAPDGSLGWWQEAGVEPIGQTWMWAADDTPDLAAYGLVPAQLCNDAGTTCVGPSVASVTAAVNSATADSSGLLEVNPANPGTGGYPLTQIIYAAVATNQSAAALSEYANLISYAAGAGQTTGTAPGDLPPGYLPLPSSLGSQAQAVVTQLQALASPSPSASASSSASSSAESSSQVQSQAVQATTGSATTAASSSTAAGTAGVTGGTSPTPTPAPAASTSPTTALVTTPASALGKVPVSSSTHPAVVRSGATTPGGPVISLPPAQAASGTTPQQPVGNIRWVLIALAVVGGGFAGGGALLRSGRLEIPMWRRRWTE
jgi:hypothetical protein